MAQVPPNPGTQGVNDGAMEGGSPASPWVAPAGQVEARLAFEPASLRVLDASDAAAALLGFANAASLARCAIDAAMPAARCLRELSQSLADGASTEAILIWWGGDGVRHLRARVERTARRLDVRLAAVPRSAIATPLPPCSSDAAYEAHLARLAHELRTPLNAVLAYAEILKEEHFGALASQRYQGCAGHIYESARHALGVIEGMLPRPAEREALPPFTFTDVDPAAVVESCLVMARPLAARAGLALTAEIPSALPRVVADEVSVKQMLLNLLANAIKFARRGDDVTVRVAYHRNGPLDISVADTGPGMRQSDPSSEPALAQPLAAAGRRQPAGLGLGLPLTRELAAANGARLAIDSSVGAGTRATITFAKDRIVLP